MSKNKGLRGRNNAQRRAILNTVTKTSPHVTVKWQLNNSRVVGESSKILVKNHSRAPLVENNLEFNEHETVFSFGTTGFNDMLLHNVAFLCVTASGVIKYYKTFTDKKTGIQNMFKNAVKGTGKDALSTMPTNLLDKLREDCPNIDACLERAKQKAALKWHPMRVEIRPCSMLLMQLLRKIHVTFDVGNVGFSCNYSEKSDEKTSERCIKANRRVGMRCALIYQGDNVVSRCFIDKSNQWARLYMANGILKNKVESALKDAGITELQNNAYNCEGYFRLNRDETAFFAPYLDSRDKKIDILDYVTAKNGNKFVKVQFDGNEFELKTTDGMVSLNKCQCSECGYELNDDDTSYLRNGEPVCHDCSSYCEECEETVLANDITTFYYRSDRYSSIEEGYCCQSCADNMQLVPFRG